ncbi:Carnosine synthase 1 [Perkinsus chesapeaki]|uniref:Carnosine synthase 1 n=1 Tax=Perkinsus chesapeaki TaxID=330153 RepID=A0A7J6N2T0_PERCH|nr:Carnosine synthase 1 [Perkinsus chesapeaki]
MEDALKVALNRPNPGTWSSPRTSRPSSAEQTGYVEELTLDDYVFELSGLETCTAGNDCIDTDKFSVGTSHPGMESVFYAEQMLDAPGSLPTPMTEEKRHSIARQMLPTATFKMLKMIPPEILFTRGPAGDSLRMQLLKGACIVFFSAGYPGKRFVYETAERLGVKSVIIDSPGSWAESLLTEGIIAKFIPIDMSQDSETIFQAAFKAVIDLKEDPLVCGADGICTMVELSVPVVARLAESLGMRGPTPSAVDTVRDKHRTREALQKAGLPGVKHYLVRSSEDLERAVQHVGLPAVMKPVSGAASLGVEKVTSLDDVSKVYEQVQRVLSKLVVNSGALERDTVAVGSKASSVKADKCINTSVVFEEYLDGQEVDIDIVLSPGLGCTYCGIHDNGPTMEPYFAETWGILPSALPKEHVAELKEMALDSLKATGFEEGVFHVEGKYTSRGPRLIEINARMGGGPVWIVHKLAFKVDLAIQAMLLSVGIPAIPIHDSENPNGAVAWLSVNAPKSGRIDDFGFLSQWLDWPLADVKVARPMVAAGEKIVGPEEGQPSWLVDIIFVAPNPTEATRLAKILYRQVEIECTKHYSI